MLARVEFEGEERVRSAYAQGKGVLFVTGHFGYWELQALVHGAEARSRWRCMARALDNPDLHRLLEQMRTRTGNSVIYRQGTMRRVMRMLQDGQGVGVLIDQHIQSRDAIHVDFFNRPAATTPIVAALAMRTGAPHRAAVRAAARPRSLSDDLRARRSSRRPKAPTTRSTS